MGGIYISLVDGLITPKSTLKKGVHYLQQGGKIIEVEKDCVTDIIDHAILALNRIGTTDETGSMCFAEY